MKKNFIIKLLLICLLINNGNLLKADIFISDWKLETSYYQTHNAVYDNENNIWVATEGGVLKYNVETEEVVKLNSLSGLSSNFANAIVYDKYRDIILVGYNDGNIDIIKKDYSVINISDLKKFFSSLNAINDFHVLSDRVLIAGQFGLTELFPDPEGTSLDQIFRDTYSKAEFNDISFYDNKVWGATNKGVLYIDVENPISDPSFWISINSENSNLRENNLGGIEFYKGELYCYYDSTDGQATRSVIYKYKNDSFQLFKSTNNKIMNISIQNEKLYVTTLFIFIDLINNRSLASHYEDGGLKNVLISPNIQDNFYFFSNNGGVIKYEDEVKTKLKVNSFYNNSIKSIKIGNNDNELWILSNGLLNKYDGNQWQIYDNSFNKNIPITNNLMKIFVSNTGDIFVGDRNKGLIVISEDNNDTTINTYNKDNSPFTSVLLDLENVAITDFVEDNQGYVWCVNWGVQSPGPIMVAYKNKNFYPFQNTESFNSNKNREYRTIALDQYGTLWLGSGGSDNYQRGLYYLNPNGTVEDTSDDIFGVIENDLPNMKINDIEYDQNDWLWLGTSKGVGFIVNPYVALNDNPNFIIENVAQMSDLNVNDIYIDPINNKWFATETGLWVYDAEGLNVILNFDKDNSPLTTNIINSLELDKNTGKMYLGTESGLFIIQTDIISPKENYDLIVYPQPFSPKKDEFLVIDGLAVDSDIKISTLDGSLIKSIITTSGRAIWNGYDEQDNIVPDGVYLIITSSSTSEKSSIAKIAVINN